MWTPDFRTGHKFYCKLTLSLPFSFPFHYVFLVPFLLHTPPYMIHVPPLFHLPAGEPTPAPATPAAAAPISGSALLDLLSLFSLFGIGSGSLCVLFQQQQHSSSGLSSSSSSSVLIQGQREREEKEEEKGEVRREEKSFIRTDNREEDCKGGTHYKIRSETGAITHFKATSTSPFFPLLLSFFPVPLLMASLRTSPPWKG